MNPFRLFSKILDWYSERVSRKAKVIIAVFVLLLLIFIGLVGYKINDYFENNPNACKLCHVHDNAHEMWAKSKHASINCHSCHHSTKKEQVIQLYRFVFLGQKTIEPRHGQIIVAWKICVECHWERNKDYPNAPLVNRSRYHAKHVFVEQVECAKCHGYVAHQFLPEERFCSKCHTNREVHGTGMEKLACINCHTDRTATLRPDREKCLFCHGDESVRKKLIDTGTIDIKYFRPSQDIIQRATKIVVPPDAPMQFYCYECHKPHKKVRPDWGDCLTRCHNDQLQVGKHNVHVKDMNMKCTDCHKPHIWRVTEKQARRDCVKCHEYKDPTKFIGALKIP